VGTLLSPAKKTSKKNPIFLKIGFLTEQLRQKNPIFLKNRIFNGAALTVFVQRLTLSQSPYSVNSCTGLSTGLILCKKKSDKIKAN
jgi:hypothetical protein